MKSSNLGNRIRQFCRSLLTPRTGSSADLSSGDVAVPSYADDGTAQDDATVAACRVLRQGDVLDFYSLPIVGADALGEVACPHGVAIITQTCDLVQPSKPYTVVAPVVELDANKSGMAKSGRMPQYVHLSGLSQDSYFVDLAHCSTVTKSSLAQRGRLSSGVNPADALAVSKFAAQVGRKFSRFPFPDDVQPWFRPLQEKITKGHGKESSLGQILRKTVDLRIQSNDWNSTGMHLTIHVIVPSSLVPSLEDMDQGEASPELMNQLRQNGVLIEDVAKIADRLMAPQSKKGPAYSAPDKHMLWSAFAEALAEACKPKERDLRPEIAEAVASVTGQLSTDEEFSLYLYLRTESLDLEHLSPPAPLAN